MKSKDWWKVLKMSGKAWNDNGAFRQSAIIAYYSIFSLPGLLILIINIAGSVYGPEAVQGRLVKEVSGMIGKDAAKSIEQIISNAYQTDAALLMRLVGIAILIFGATTVFFQLQKSLNYIWRVEHKPGVGIKRFIFDRFYSLSLIIVIAFLLLISLVLSATIAAFSEWFSQEFPEFLYVIVASLDAILSLGVTTILFAIIFKVLPDVSINWKSVWLGAFFTALLFTLGKYLLGFYFGEAEPTSTYGTAGSIILVMLWINYSCLILFFGAEFTKAYTEVRGYPVKLNSYAIRVPTHEKLSPED